MSRFKQQKLRKERTTAVGHTAEGVKIIFAEPDYIIAAYCAHRKLTSLKIYYGVRNVYCWDNNLQNLTLPKTVRYVKCDPDLFDYNTCKVERVEIMY